jgi:hypothetical protein
MKNDTTRGRLLQPHYGTDLELLTPKEAASFLRVSESFLAKARMRGDGPRYRKLSRSVRYDKADLLLWLKASARTSTAELGSGSSTRQRQNPGPSMKEEE